ncbi:MAG: hypothetical protein KTR31_31775, partial [Myxococcales bacterium]|nr:hypothetical protein [Myxococcales bacterium]
MLRWGQSAYETDLDLQREQQAATALGLGWRAAPESPDAPDLQGVGALVVTSRVRVNAEVLARFEGSLVLTTSRSMWSVPEVVEQALHDLMGLMRRRPALHRAASGDVWARAAL